MNGRAVILTLLVLVVLARPATPDDGAARVDQREVKAPSAGTRLVHEFLLPFGSVIIPGLGQWSNGATEEGFLFFGAALAGVAIGASGETEEVDIDDLPRDKDTQFAQLGLQLTFAAGLLSGYDSFRRSLPRLSAGGRYEFLKNPTPVSKTLAAPVKFHYLKKKTTWIFLSIPIAIVVAVAIDERDNKHLPFEWHDAVYAAGSSYGAGVSEEAFFRGYLYPWFNESFGERTWIANTAQALLFGLAHLPNVEVPWTQALGGFYWGWLVQRSDWDFQEPIFQHFWWNTILFTGALLLDDGGDTTLSIVLPPLKF